MGNKVMNEVNMCDRCSKNHSFMREGGEGISDIVHTDHLRREVKVHAPF